MASFELPQPRNPRVSPALMVGVASPLWSYFAAAAAGGVAYWWMTQWARPVNLEAMFGKARAAAGNGARPRAGGRGRRSHGGDGRGGSGGGDRDGR